MKNKEILKWKQFLINLEAAIWKAKSLRSKQGVLNLLNYMKGLTEALPKMKFYREFVYTLAK